MAAENTFEYMAFARETVRGTPVTPPTHLINSEGTLTPQRTYRRGRNNLGTRALNRKGAVVKKSGAFESGDMDLDLKLFPFLAQMVINGSVTAPTTPTNATLTRRWTFPRTMNSDNLKSATAYWGDPNNKIWQGEYAMIDELTVSSDTSGDEFAQMSYAGTSHFPVKLSSPPTKPTANIGHPVVPSDIEVWLDVAGALGTTKLIGRVVSCEHTFPSGVTYKYPGQGPASGKNYHHTGLTRTECTTVLVIELIDQAEYDIYEGAQQAKLRVKHNGVLIETHEGSSTNFYEHLQVDMYGTLDELSWDILEGSNRTLSLTMISEENDVAGTDCVVEVQNTLTAA